MNKDRKHELESRLLRLKQQYGIILELIDEAVATLDVNKIFIAKEESRHANLNLSDIYLELAKEEERIKLVMELREKTGCGVSDLVPSQQTKENLAAALEYLRSKGLNIAKTGMGEETGGTIEEAHG